ncbi:TetR/AcrR family transcriptional regulator [Catenuloplanes atrovinosus]|uniref:AcrR family transcriptional regulator n=1 Tax=Catenuloplanes atrovinosus TaxID=137266 RepID=A0AAE3YUC9_9ACTN|nr:TetR family transcriptional regulator [Catenuloplanes atrovinosus]MDR7280069.1 AcrR family transcriptional regulator [Catenuloplanes atrovinosus]
MSTGPSLRQRTRDRMRQEVVTIALQLFAERGFDAVTTTDIAAAAGISPRSFFRYFPTKEDVVLSGLHGAAERVRDALIARPGEEPVWESLRLAFHHLVGAPGSPAADVAGVADIVMYSTSMQMRSADKRHDWESLLVPVIAERLPGGASNSGVSDEDRARALLAAGLACVDTAARAWIGSNRTGDPIAILDALMGQLRLD